MTQDQIAFNEVVEIFQQQYPSRKIVSKFDENHWVISIDGEDKFTTEGYNLLFNLKRLCDALSNELE